MTNTNNTFADLETSLDAPATQTSFDKFSDAEEYGYTPAGAYRIDKHRDFELHARDVSGYPEINRSFKAGRVIVPGWIGLSMQEQWAAEDFILENLPTLESRSIYFRDELNKIGQPGCFQRMFLKRDEANVKFSFRQLVDQVYANHPHAQTTEK